MKAIPRLALTAVALGALLVAGCTASASSDPARLEGTWKLEAFGGISDLEPVGADAKTDMTFAEGEVTGNGGVNSFGSKYEAQESGEISFEPIIATKMAGPEPDMTRENDFFAALEKTERFSFEGDKLVLSDRGNNTLLVLVQK